jgi:hypothetical protein
MGPGDDDVAQAVKFYLGTHMPNWLATSDVPLFVSRRRLAGRRRLPRAGVSWALDSGGFTELQMHGRWTVSAEQYAAEVVRFQHEIGNMDWAAPQDWMCEPHMLRKTGLTVEEHQRRTVDNLLELSRIAPDVPWAPVLQGWAIDDYLRHVAMYEAAGVDLRAEKVVGVGSVCRRQATKEAVRIFRTLHALGLQLHGFGVKTSGVAELAVYLASADSLAWSFNARKRPPLGECDGKHVSCANCIKWAMAWRSRVIGKASAKRVLQVCMPWA